MTTARSSRSKRAIAAGLTALAIAQVSAHRRDEYLQAARIAIEPARVQIELDLTPGIALAQRVLDEIDLDRNGLLNASEADAYAARVVNEIRLQVDDRPLPLELTSRRFPEPSDMLKGEGTIRLQMSAPVPALPAGAHRVFYRNDHHQKIGAYLANALVPATDRVSIRAQHRDGNQRELAIEYVLRDAVVTGPGWWSAAGFGGLVVMFAGVLWRRRYVLPIQS